MDDQHLFSLAVDIEDADQRAVFLDEQCGDEEQRRRLDGLLAAHDRSINLSQLPTQPPDTGPASTSNRAPEQIGPYKILEPLGEGGMGTVFMAQQDQPVRRRVAIKIIKPGMDSRQIIARFEAEQQALALMNHEHIAKVFDAGTTDDGRPYFVMELVQGIPITEYCDQHRLNTEERLNLLIPVCQAIQHAHQKGVIHRDIKPSNVLVAEGDSGPTPKVIDFGLAKALQQQLTNSSVFTQLGQVMGTLEYMSPEQAELKVTDIDTRTDVYALGVLMYELLTGSTPIGRKRLKSEAFDRILQIIREEEPQRPSARLSESSDTLPTLASQRRSEPNRLSHVMRGDLDAIVMKALDKDRARRYDSATGLAADIERYLMHEPVEAQPPSAAYRLRKLARKYRAAVVTAAAFLALLLASTVLSAWLAVRATNAEAAARVAQKRAQNDAAIAKEVSAFLQEDLLAQANPLESSDRDLKLRTVLDRAAEDIERRFPDQPLVEASIRSTLGAAYEALGEYDVAEPHLKRAKELREQELGDDHPETLTSINDQGSLYFNMGRYDDAEKVLKIALESGRRVLGEEDRETLTVANNLSMVYYMTGRLDQAAPLIAENLKIAKRVLGVDHEDTVAMVTNLGTIYEAIGRYEEALPMLKEANASFTRLHGPDHPHTLATNISMGRVYRATGKLEDAEREFGEALTRFEATLGNDHLQTLGAMHDLGTVHLAQGRYVDAENRLVAANSNIRRVLGEQHPASTKTAISVGVLYVSQDRFDKAAPLLETALEQLRATFGEANFEVHNVKNNLGVVYRAQGRFEEADKLLTEALDALRGSFGETHFRTTSASYNLAAVEHAQGRFDEAERRYLETQEKQTEGLGPDHTQTLTTRSTLARLYQDQGRFEEAEPLQQEALASARAALGDQHPITLVAMNHLAVLHRRQRQYDAASKRLEELISAYRQRFDSGEATIALRLGQALVELALCRIGRENLDEARKIAAEAVSILEASEQSAGWHLDQARSVLGESIMLQKEFSKAEPLLLDAFAALEAAIEQMPSPQRNDIPHRTVEALVQLYSDWNKPEQAETWKSKRSAVSDQGD